jgi:Na+/H+-dicarboxylate symporter
MIFRKLYVQVLLALVAGVLLGLAAPYYAVEFKVLSDIFIRLIRMILAPVIFCTVVLGIAKMENLKELGRVGIKSLLYFEAASTLALLIGLIVVNVVRPGDGLNVDPATLDAKAVAQYTSAAAKQDGIIGFFIHMVPSSIVDSFAQGDILQILFFGVLFGIALSQAGSYAAPVVNFMESFLDAIFRIVRMVMKVAPLGAFGAMAFTIGRYGLGSLVSLAQVMLCVYATCVLFVALGFGLAARLCGFPLWRFLNYIRDEIFTVVGTCSSESVLPQLMRKLELAGVPKSVVGLVIPGGLTFNADGSAIYFTIGAMFIAQATHTQLSWSDQITVLGVLMLTSKGSAGVAGAGFVTLAATLSALDKVPVAGLVLLLGIDRFMAEARSVTNTIGNAVGAVVVAAWENCLDRDMLAKALNGDAQEGQTAPVSLAPVTLDWRAPETAVRDI